MAIEMDTNGAVTGIEEFSLPSQLDNLSKLIGEKPEGLATGSEQLRKVALHATKFIYDLALTTEKEASGKVNDLLISISPSYAPQTRSQTANAEGNRKRKRGPSPPPSSQPTVPILKDTPLAELLVEGMSDEQIWAELELRAQTVCDVLNYALDGPVPEGERGEEGDEASEDDDRDEADRVQRVKELRQALLDEGFDPADLEGMELGEGDEDERDDSEEEDEDEESEENEEDGGDMDLGEGVEELRDPSDSDEEDELEVHEPSFLNGGKRTLKIKIKRGGHPALDDGFFDLAAFNAEIEAAESRSSSRGRLSQDDEDEDEDDVDEEVDYFASVDAPKAFDEEDLEGDGELFYKDFFEPPARSKVPKAKKAAKPVADGSTTGKVRFHEEVRVKKIKAKGKNLPMNTMFYEEDEDEDDDDEYEGEEGLEIDGYEDESLEDEDEEMADLDPNQNDEESEQDGDVSMEEGEEIASEAGFATMERLKDDLFAEDEGEEGSQENLSTHEKRMDALREEITALELENVGKKDWTLIGEATSRTRPQNSLLEEDLEFERVMKSVPVITEDVVHSLEERIKARILENRFDDVVRKRPVDDKPFLPSRFFELQDSKSKKSLAEIYEDEYTAAQSRGVSGGDRDGKLKKEHQEIEKLWESICGKLDALCNAHFTPKAPKATITSVSNVAAATLESALPTTKATSTMLAPQEVYAPTSNSLRARSELRPGEKRAMRNKQKKANKKARDAIQKSVQNFGRPKGVGDMKRQKEAALKTLVKSGKGVTVVGKKSKEFVEGRRGRGGT